MLSVDSTYPQLVNEKSPPDSCGGGREGGRQRGIGIEGKREGGSELQRDSGPGSGSGSGSGADS